MHEDIIKVIKDLVQEGMAAREYYQIWSALRLRQEDFPYYKDTLMHPDYRDFFSTSSTAHFKLIFISLGKIFDPRPKTSSIHNLKKALKKANRVDLVTYIEEKLGNQDEILRKIKNIRNKSIAHNQRNPSKQEIYKMNPVAPDELCPFIDETCEVINQLAQKFCLSTMCTSDRVKQSTLEVLRALTATKVTDQKGTSQNTLESLVTSAI